MEKAKNDMPRMGAARFLSLWTAAHIAGWLLALFLWSQFGIGKNDQMANALLVALVPGLTAAAGETVLMRGGLRKARANRWFMVSLVGQLMSAGIYYQLLHNMMYPSTTTMITVLFVPAAIVQAVWLHRQVKSAWLWVVTAVVSAMVFAMAVQSGNTGSSASDYVVLGLGGILQGIITGSVMRHLWTREREKDKRSLITELPAADNQAERIERLHEAAPDEQDDVEAESLARLLR